MFYAFIFLFIIITLWLWTFHLQYSHFRNAEEYFAKSGYKLAMREYDSALHLYTPFSPLTEKSASRLWQIGETYENMEQPDWALIAYSSLRSSFYASQNIYLPGKDWIRRCDEKMAGINVKLLTKTGDLKPANAAQEKEKFLHFYRYEGAPNIFRSVMACVALFGWIVSVIFLCMKAIGPDGRLKRNLTVYSCLSFATFFVAWVMALLTA